MGVEKTLIKWGVEKDKFLASTGGRKWDVKGSIMVPIHNGTFDLAFHSSFDPLERVHAAAEEAGVLLRTLQVGGENEEFKRLTGDIDNSVNADSLSN